MEDIYAYLYEEYSKFYVNQAWIEGEWTQIPAVAVCNHRQIDTILHSFDEDEDILPVLECMHSCIGCTGNHVPALED